MCFAILEDAKPRYHKPTAVRYKVVLKYTGSMIGTYYQGPNYTVAGGYRVGEVTRAAGLSRAGAARRDRSTGVRHARAGIYVYTTLAAARSAHAATFWRAILRLRVERKDFLHTSMRRNIETYRKVLTLGEVK